MRNYVKKVFLDNGLLTTEPTEAGEKVLDIFHESFRVKRLQHVRLAELNKFSTDDARGDIFLDIVQNENKKLIEVHIGLDEHFHGHLIENFLHLLVSESASEEQRSLGREIIIILLRDYLLPELAKELRAELQEAAERYVIARSQMRYQQLLMTGPFQRAEAQAISGPRRSEYIPDRPRCAVMGVVYNQLD